MGEPLKLNNEGVVTVVHSKMRLISTYLKKSLKKNSVNSNGFSMLEAVVVVGVLLALAVGGFFAYGPITENAKRAIVTSEASKIYTAATVAQIDGDPSTTMATVLDDYNHSTDKIRISVRRSTDTEFTSTPDASFDSADGDYCIRAERIGDESVFAETGTCEAGDDGSDPGDGSGDPSDGDPDDAPPAAPVLNPNALTTLSYKCDSTKQVDSPFYQNVTGTETWSDGVTATYSNAFNPAPRTLQAGVDYTVTFKGTYGSLGAAGDTCVRSLDQWDDGAGVTRAAYSFRGATNLVSVPESIPSSLNDMSYMFAGDGNFNSPNVSKWNTANVTNMSYMFSEATAFNQPLNSWGTSKVTDMSSMFRSAVNFNQSLASWDTARVADMSHMFENAIMLDQPLQSWNTSSVANMSSMFGGANAFNQPIGAWNTGNVTDMSYMFGSTALFDQPLNTWDTSKITDFTGMFYAAKVFNQPLNNWNTSSANKLNFMFGETPMFNQSLNNWDISKVTDLSGMFSEAAAFNQPLNNWNTSSVVNMNTVFYRAEVFNQPLNNWNTSNVEKMSQMFMQSSSFNQPLNTWDTSKVTDMSGMFWMAFGFDQPLNNWDTSKVTEVSYMFSSADSFNQDLSSWNMSSVSASGKNEFASYTPNWSLPKPSGF